MNHEPDRRAWVETRAVYVVVCRECGLLPDQFHEPGSARAAAEWHRLEACPRLPLPVDDD